MIEIENLSKFYTHQKTTAHALKNINISIRPGEIFGIIGKSGAGKSTLLRCINLLERPTSGKIMVAKQNLMELSATQLREARHHIGMIFQHFNLLSSATVAQNIAIPLILRKTSKALIVSKVKELLKLVDLVDKANYYPSQLSGGQKQRVAIARALACDPKVLLCDEATSALDAQSTISILQLLRQINEQYNLTIVLITHEIEVVKQICQRVAVIDNGEIIEQSAVIDLFYNPQQEITRHLISDSINKNLSDRIKRNLSGFQLPNSYPLIQITFLKEAAAQPIIASIVRKFNIDLNILQAYMEDIQQQPFGVMTLQLTADDFEQQNIIDYLRKLNLHVEVLGYVTDIAS